MCEQRRARGKVTDFLQIKVSELKIEPGERGLETVHHITHNLPDCGPIGVTVSLEEADNPNVFLCYNRARPGGQPQRIECEVSLVTTPCRFGGRRYWFLCPRRINGVRCERRVGVLYKLGDVFGCRHCFNLTYKSRNLSGIFKKIGVIDIDLLLAAQDPGNWRYYKEKPTKRYRKLMKMNKKFSMWCDFDKAKTESFTKKISKIMNGPKPKMSRGYGDEDDR